MNKDNQTSSILALLLDGHEVTSMLAFELYGCTRLSAKIYDLRKRGYNIETHMKVGKTRFGDTCEYAVYKLVKEDNDNE